MGAPLVTIPSGPGSDWTFAVKQPINQGFDDCAFPARPGQLFNEPNPALAQAPMAGGGDSNLESHAYIAREWPVSADVSKAQVAMAGGKRRRCWTRRMRGGGCGCTGSKLLYGGSRRRGTRRMRGGSNNGFAVMPNLSVGGSGPNAAPVYAGVPCDGRAGAVSSGPVDPRAPQDLYSLTANQTGGAYSSGNAYSADCYRAPGSQLPVYPADVAGFSFRPSTAAGATLPDGVTAYNDVVPYAARTGGARRRRRTSKAHKKNRKTRRRRSHRK